MDNQILSLYAKGITTREIAAAFKDLYDADVSPALISKVTDAVMIYFKEISHDKDHPAPLRHQLPVL